MAKNKEKDLLGNFTFGKSPKITEGLVIPTERNIPTKKPKIDVPTNKPNVVPTTTKKVVPTKTVIDVPAKPKIDSSKFSAMTNTLPTIEKPINKPKKQKQQLETGDLDMVEFASLKTKEEKVSYLAMRGWSLKVEPRKNTFYHYATKYINRKKKRLYLGSINS